MRKLLDSPWLYFGLAALLAVLPDLDAFSSAAYGAILGHRGWTHSLVFALWLAFLTASLTFRLVRGNLWTLTGVYFLAAASHGILDAFTRGGAAIPFFWPVVAGLDYGLDANELKIWFGIIILIVVELGLITPPVGLNVFIISSLAPDVPMRETFKGVMPFFFAELVRVTVLVAFPVISVFLPRWLT